MKGDSLGDRMKRYEYVSRTYLTRRVPVIIRLDGKAFHTFTRGFEKPYEIVMMRAMQKTMQALCSGIHHEHLRKFLSLTARNEVLINGFTRKYYCFHSRSSHSI